MPWQGEVERSSRVLSLRIGAVGPWGVSFRGWRVGAFTAYGVRMRPPLCCIRTPPDPVEGTQCVKAERSRTTCPRRLSAEEINVAVASTINGGGESLMSRRCW
jgi:hypothetical protein